MDKWKMDVGQVYAAGNSVATVGTNVDASRKGTDAVQGVSDYADLMSAATSFVTEWHAPLGSVCSSLQHLGHTVRDIALAVDADDQQRSNYFKYGKIQR